MNTQPILRLATLVAVLSWPFHPVWGAGAGTENPEIKEDRAAIENCLAIIRGCQMKDGLIRMKGHGNPVWAVPYFGNLAAMALLAANNTRQDQQDVIRVERWLMWYAAHQEADGTIYDQEGTVSAYQSNGKRDSTDSYAATLLMATWRYRKAAKKRPSAPIVNAAQKAFAAIEAVVQTDGLTIAKPEYPMKFLMDNVEVYQGLSEGAMFFGSVGMEAESDKARRMAFRIAKGMGKFWSDQGGHFAYALDMKGTFFAGLSKPYPHGLAQLFALAHITPTRPGLWVELNRSFKPGDAGIPADRWLIAARRYDDPKGIVDLRAATRSAALQFSSENVYVERPAMAIIALTDGEARFPDVPTVKENN